MDGIGDKPPGGKDPSGRGLRPPKYHKVNISL